MWMPIDKKDIDAAGFIMGTPVPDSVDSFLLYGWNGQRWPRLLMSAYSSNNKSDWIFFCGTMQSSAGPWKATNIPGYLFADLAKLFAYYALNIPGQVFSYPDTNKEMPNITKQRRPLLV